MSTLAFPRHAWMTSPATAAVRTRFGRRLHSASGGTSPATTNGGSGGLVSHAAFVARGRGIPAVVGAQDLTVGPADVRDADGTVLFRAGDTVTIDGTTGRVWLGGVGGSDTGAATDEQILARYLPELAVLIGR
ncbi:PEP-utilizing enzyme [Pseudonocardia abyssalis]|uniref:PEP-utilizing enzyme n=1 Tax=Pseudonocardia abyssalis TaxID=2792008 RepID=UPI001CF688DF|nr:PEP-utilizing enzyme [Pseudonocardia abyssalis]